jgi:hypothetical protein
MPGMGRSKPLGHDDLDRLSEELLSRVAEELFRLTVDDDDAAVFADDDERVRRCFEQIAKLRLRSTIC